MGHKQNNEKRKEKRKRNKNRGPINKMTSTCNQKQLVFAGLWPEISLFHSGIRRDASLIGHQLSQMNVLEPLLESKKVARIEFTIR